MNYLYIVATPIGNLEDISYRAVRTLSEVDCVLCEDTRVTRKLLGHYEIDTPVLSYHANSTEAKHEEILKRLEAGETMALVSDAGTPCISDPGVQLVSLVRETLGEQVAIQPIPGASALTAAFSVAGIKGNQFIFMGYLPHKKGRQTMFEEMSKTERAIVFYESPHRIIKTLESLKEYIPLQRKVIIARELTKIHEEIIEGSSSYVYEYYHNNPDKVRGEFVVMIDQA